jgi:hypothetical protein
VADAFAVPEAFAGPEAFVGPDAFAGPGSPGYAATAGNPTPITFNRRESAVNANSFIA